MATIGSRGYRFRTDGERLAMVAEGKDRLEAFVAEGKGRLEAFVAEGKDRLEAFVAEGNDPSNCRHPVRTDTMR